MPIISEAEKQRRRLAIGSVVGSHIAEGIELDSVVRGLMERFASGEIDLPQFSAAMQRHAESVGAVTTLAGAA
jgi:hypothetical protein